MIVDQFRDLCTTQIHRSKNSDPECHSLTASAFRAATLSAFFVSLVVESPRVGSTQTTASRITRDHCRCGESEYRVSLSCLLQAELSDSAV
jgi:hypothetical protein